MFQRSDSRGEKMGWHPHKKCIVNIFNHIHPDVFVAGPFPKNTITILIYISQKKCLLHILLLSFDMFVASWSSGWTKRCDLPWLGALPPRTAWPWFVPRAKPKRRWCNMRSRPRRWSFQNETYYNHVTHEIMWTHKLLYFWFHVFFSQTKHGMSQVFFAA